MCTVAQRGSLAPSQRDILSALATGEPARYHDFRPESGADTPRARIDTRHRAYPATKPPAQVDHSADMHAHHLRNPDQT